MSNLTIPNEEFIETGTLPFNSNNSTSPNITEINAPPPVRVNGDLAVQNMFLEREIMKANVLNNQYFNVEANRQWIYNNEAGKYHALNSYQTNLLERINTPHIRLWRQKDKLYFRDNSGELIIETSVGMEKELSSRYGLNVHFINDLNEVLLKKNEVRINTTYIALNRITTVEEELFLSHENVEIAFLQTYRYVRNLLAATRYWHNRYTATNMSFINILSTLTYHKEDPISKWIANIDFIQDKILLLYGNQNASKDLVVNKVLKPLFNGFVVTITEEMLSKYTIEEIVTGKLFLHIDQIPKDIELRKKLQELLVAVVIQRAIPTEGYTTKPTQAKVIVTLDKADPFFSEYMEITTTLSIDTMENILRKHNLNSKPALYLALENGLNYIASEIYSKCQKDLTLNSNDNHFYLEALKAIAPIDAIGYDGLPILDPFKDSFERLIPIRERFKHAYITGQSSSGKTECVKSMSYSDILRNDGVTIVLESHGDLTRDMAKLPIDENRLVYLDSTLQEGMTFSINLFDWKDKSESNIQKVSRVIVSVIKSVNDDEKFSGAMEEMLFYGCCLLLRKGNSDFFELVQLFSDNKNTELLKLAKNSPRLEREYFEDFAKTNKATQDAVKRRVSKILNDSTLCNLLTGQSTIDLEKMMNTKGQVIIFRIQKSEMLDSYIYYARFIIGLIQIIALKRANLEEENRVRTYLYIDEFHNFITPTIEEILTESRKYALYLTLAHQTISQLKKPALRDIILSNTNVKLIGKNSNKTLDAMNNTFSTKLEDVEKLATGEFYLSVGNNDILKIKNTDRFLDGKENITDSQWIERKHYQLRHYYRSIENHTSSFITAEELDRLMDQFIGDIESKNVEGFIVIKEKDPIVHEELVHNFNDGDGFIAQTELCNYFNMINGDVYHGDNRNFIELLKSKNAMFRQNPKENKKYKDKFRYAIARLEAIPS